MSTIWGNLKWSHELTLHFIELYKNKPVLWDSKHPIYYDKLAKHYAWEELATEMNIHLYDCKQKIRCLRSAFHREKSKIKQSHGTGTGRDEVYEGSWFAFKSMSFLMKKNILCPTLNTIITNETSTINEQDEPITSTSVDHETENQKILRPKNNKRKLDKEDDMLNKFNILSASAASTTGEDEYSSYGSYIENKLRQYSAKTRSAVQYAISDILLQADKMNIQNRDSSRFHGMNLTFSTFGHGDVDAEQHGNLDDNNMIYVPSLLDIIITEYPENETSTCCAKQENTDTVME